MHSPRRTSSLLAFAAIFAVAGACGSRTQPEQNADLSAISDQAAALAKAGGVKKKGVGAWSTGATNKGLADLNLGWYYSWAPGFNGTSAPAGVEFVPQIWGEKNVNAADFAEAKKHGNVLLGFNEPDNPPFQGSSVQMSVQRALDLWPQLQGTGMQLCSPAPAKHDFNNANNWFVQFMNGAKQRGYRVDKLCLHWYGSNFNADASVAELRAFLQSSYDRYKLPIWLTEYSLIGWGGGTPQYPPTAVQADFAAKSAAMLDSLPFVERYAWFSLIKYTSNGSENTHLYDGKGQITAVGTAYRAAGGATAGGPATPPPASGDPVPGPAPVPAGPSKPGTVGGFLVNKESQAARDAQQAMQSKAPDANLLDLVARSTVAVWYGGWNGDIKTAVRRQAAAAEAADAVALMVAYNIPSRDCGQFSAGGLGADAYRQWITDFAAGIGNAKAYIVLEPDALGLIDCLSAAGQAERNSLLAFAVDQLKRAPNARVYLDGGHANWKTVEVMAARLQAAGIAKADGFALNTSNYVATDLNTAYGLKVRAITGKNFIIDTDRNGNGAKGSEWCNPSGRALGQLSTITTGVEGLDALAWIHSPGESDGTCNGGPAAGAFWRANAVDLAKGARWDVTPPVP